METLLQSSTARPLIFFLYQSSDHVTGLTGASPTVVISKNGGSFASPSGAVSEIGNGFYKVAGNATDTDTIGTLCLSATAASADQGTIAYNVVAYAQDSATNLGLSNLDATISSRTKPADTQAAVTTVTNLTNAPTAGDLTATMKASVTAAVPNANANADALLGRNIDGGSSSGRTVTQSLAFLRNKWTISGTTLTVYDVDDTSVLWTATISTNASAQPIVGNDPA